MMKHEFEALAGYEVSVSDYDNIIEPMYMATELSKEDFVKVICKERFAFALKSREEIIQEMRKIAGHLKKTCDHFMDIEAEEKLKELAEEYKERFGPYKGGFLLNTRYTLEHLGKGRGCSYPAELEIYNSKYHTTEKIKIA
ncbi:hypothetical protein C808_00646 [Lachnospiraceae bacterium M18-1]|nr:hypothetical protein C808_00646 [Lachnospiraceae bacterium M18-1]